MMHLRAIRRFDPTAAGGAQSVLDRIRPHVGQWHWPQRSTATFYGTVDSDGFTIERAIPLKNAFVPVVIGRVRDEGSGCVVSITMRLHRSVAIFMAVYFAGILAFGLAMVAPARIQEDWTLVLLPLGLFGLGAEFYTVPFAIEARAAERELTRILSGQSSEVVL